ncbi:1245_t:CDS:2, partial [Dentiscutata erythropus]
EKDENLRLIFDNINVWNEFTYRSRTFTKLEFDTPLSTRKFTGLFRNPELTSPQGFQKEAEKAVRRVKLLINRITNANTDEELRKVVKNLDRLSDILCSVIDTAEFVRTVHPDQKFSQEANRVYEYLCSFMNSLNTNRELYQVLKRVISTPSISSQFSSEERQVAHIFLRDFEKSGIHLPSSDRDKFVQLSDKIITLGRKFTHSQILKSTNIIEVDASCLDGLHTGWSTKNSDTARLSTKPWEAQMVLKLIKDENIRKKMFIASNSATKEQIDLLENLLRTRGELARLLGMDSYSHVFLIDKMIKNPDHVQKFLRTLADHHRPKALADLCLLREAKRQEIKCKELPIVNAWDRDYYTEKIKASSAQPVTPISPYFSVGSVIQGLSRLFSKLYGISFEPSEILPGETWHDDVRKLDVIDEQEGKIGTIYCDLFNRHGKYLNAAHYTVRCSRRVDDDDSVRDIPPDMDISEIGELATSEQGVRLRGRNGRYQLPIIVLTCDFARPKGDDGKPSLLSLVETETLFHEMGHAMHSMIGRTDFHNVSGTRCPTDFVELPSILMEHFVYSPTVLSLFAKHYDTRKPIPLDLISSHLKARSQFSAMETQYQILMSLLDQIYHSTLAMSTDFDTTAILANLQDTVGLFPSVPETAWQIQFVHLFGYGAGYYSYLFCRMLAGKLWKQVFEKDPLSREAGQRFREEVLKWGGSRDPWLCVGKALQDEKITVGDSESVSFVGEWVDCL